LRAITGEPGTANSIKLEDLPKPVADGALLVRALALGVCGTDRDIIDGHYGWAPPGAKRLVLGHESLGKVEQAPSDGDFNTGDLVVGIVRRPDPVPCPACAVDEWDMCRNGKYTERGIKEINGYGAEHYSLEPDFAVKVDPALGHLGVLIEPASVIAKAWDHIERIGKRTKYWKPRTLMVTGAGPVGLLAALFGAQRGLEVHVLDRATGGPKPQLVRDLGATYHTGNFGGVKADIVIECTGAAPVIREAISGTASDGITCLAGIGAPGQETPIDLSSLNRTMVLENDVVFGSVNANRAHYRAAADGLAKADKDWLGRLITRRVPLLHWHEAFEKRPGDVKVIIDFTM
jgi:threonine dehydrogenase-like Zn-dependent dehydrogenase